MENLSWNVSAENIDQVEHAINANLKKVWIQSNEKKSF